MNPKKELRIAYCLAIVLLVIGLLSYAAFPAKRPVQPIRKMFKATAGKVLFQHKVHTIPSGYGVSCSDCHHHPANDESSLRSCTDCHQPKEALPASCLDCHETDEIKEAKIVTRTDAFHFQCINCHKNFGAGPVECQECHVK